MDENRKSYLIHLTDAEAAAMQDAHPEYECERAYHYDAAKAKIQREKAAQKRKDDKAELEALRALKASLAA